MKTKVWEALIDKEETRVSAESRQLETIQQQHQYLCERMKYIEELVSEYSSSAAGTPLQRSNYQLQLYRMREKLSVEADLLSERTKQIKQSLAGHYGEIRKFDKMRLLTEQRRQDVERRAENKRDDESGTLQFNFQRRGY